MNALIENFVPLLLDAGIKSFLILGLAWVVAMCWRRASAATRHWVWFVAVAALPLLPWLSLAQWPWQKPLWHVSTELIPGNQFALKLEFAPAQPTPPMPGEMRPITLRSAPQVDRAVQFDRRWLWAGPVVWLAGVMLVLTPLAVARIRLWRICRRARAPGWTPSLPEAGRGRRVLVLESAEGVMPMTFGCWQSVILLPSEAQQWPEDRQRIVLLHEFAHVRRRDCLTQMVTRIIGAFYWFNPLVWVAARRMCVERERACDDFVLNQGCKASDYASHLVEIAQRFRCVPEAAAVAMARPSGLERRVTAILDRSRNRKRLAKLTAALLICSVSIVALLLGACATSRRPAATQWSLERSEVGGQLKRFVAEKKAQAFAAAAPEGRDVLPEYRAMFAAANRGDWHSISNLWEDMRARAPQYEGGGEKDARLHGTAWQTMLEIWGSFGHFALGEEKENVCLGREAIASIEPGSIYFGGTDPGRCVITALQKSHVNADPFFTITQNALADSTYLTYLRGMYGDRIYIPTEEDNQRSFSNYVQDAQARLKANKLKAGEDVTVVEGRVQVSGQVAVMAINARLARIIFGKNPDREFYIEESFPLDWMYPYLTPNGPIMKINRQAVSVLSEDILRKDREYWMRLVAPMIGDWLESDTTIQEIAVFATRTYTRQREPDQYYHRGSYMAGKWASKLRSSIAGVYVWRAENATDEAEKARMRREADFAFRQAFALCPFSPEAVFRYVNLLIPQKRLSDALLLAETGAALQPADQFRNLVKQLKDLQKGE